MEWAVTLSATRVLQEIGCVSLVDLAVDLVVDITVQLNTELYKEGSYPAQIYWVFNFSVHFFRYFLHYIRVVVDITVVIKTPSKAIYGQTMTVLKI